MTHAQRHTITGPHRRQSTWPGALLLILIGLVLVGATLWDGRGRRPHEHPAADGVVTRAEIEIMLGAVNREHAAQRAAIEAVNARVDRVIDAVEAIAPKVPGRMRAPTLLDEARR